MRTLTLLLFVSLPVVADIVVDTTGPIATLYQTSDYKFCKCQKTYLSLCDSVDRSESPPKCLCNSSWNTLFGFRVSGLPVKLRMVKVKLSSTSWAWLDSGVIYFSAQYSMVDQWVQIEHAAYQGDFRLVFRNGPPLAIEPKPKTQFRRPMKSRGRTYNALGKRSQVNVRKRHSQIEISWPSRSPQETRLDQSKQTRRLSNLAGLGESLGGYKVTKWRQAFS